VLSLFSGIGGLDLGVRLAVPEARTVCYVEREAYACAVLAARMQEGALAPAPIWSDVRTFDGLLWRGRVHCVAGGFPCTDISWAGKGLGLAGEHSGLWFEFVRILRETRPAVAFVENVAALARRGLDQVLWDLASLGFDAEWDVFKASDAGAPHRRERLFILAHADREGLRRQRVDVEPVGQELRDEAASGCDAERSRGSHVVAFPPGPDERSDWERYLVEHPHLEPGVRRGADGLANRVERLRALGNGVVPQQAALAWAVLMGRLAS
jgi:DNA (cytosine-5)-methyltransferase 1